MIKLKKLQEPDALILNKAKWTTEYKAAKAARAKNLEELKTKYRDPEIKVQIVRETNGKCAYCESKIRHAYPGDVEHIKPKSDFEDDIFEWENLTLSCGECNRRKLDNYDETIGIINPYAVDPENHLFAAGPCIFARPGDIVGEIAYELFELNRTELLEMRKDKIDELKRQLHQYAGESNELLKKLYKRNIERAKNNENEYALVTKSFIKLSLSKKKTTK